MGTQRSDSLASCADVLATWLDHLGWIAVWRHWWLVEKLVGLYVRALFGMMINGSASTGEVSTRWSPWTTHFPSHTVTVLGCQVWILVAIRLSCVLAAVVHIERAWALLIRKVLLTELALLLREMLIGWDTMVKFGGCGFTTPMSNYFTTWEARNWATWAIDSRILLESTLCDPSCSNRCVSVLNKSWAFSMMRLHIRNAACWVIRAWDSSSSLRLWCLVGWSSVLFVQISWTADFFIAMLVLEWIVDYKRRFVHIQVCCGSFRWPCLPNGVVNECLIALRLDEIDMLLWQSINIG